MSHSSVYFDKVGFAEDVNIVFPLDRFKQLQVAGIIGNVASIHYSFMGLDFCLKRTSKVL